MEKLSDEEKQKLGNMCDSIDCSKVNVFRGNDSKMENRFRDLVLKISGGRSVTLGNSIFLSERDSHSIEKLSHEMTHVSQYQSWGAIDYYAHGAVERMYEAGGGDPYALPADLAGGQRFGKWFMEQQAQIVQFCFAGNVRNACSISPFAPGR